MLAFCTAGQALAQSPFTTGFRYDAGGRQAGIVRPDPDGGGPLKFPAVRNSFDANGNLEKVEEGELQTWPGEATPPSAWADFQAYKVSTFSYDASGRKVVSYVRDASGVAYGAVQTNYDVYDRPVCTAVRMNVSSFDNLPADACSLAPTGSFGPDRISRSSYDAFGQLTKTERAVGTVVQQDYATYTYNTSLGDLDKPTSVKDANGNVTTMVYGGSVYNKITKQTFPSASVAGQVNANDYEEYGYDADGNRTSWRKRDGRVFTYSYDALNRMTSKTVPDGCAPLGGGACPAASATRDVYYGYDLRGLQTFARFDSAVGEGVTNTYTGFAELASSTTAMAGVSRTLSYLYDADGDRTRITHPDGVYFTLGFDGLDRMASGSWWAPATGTVPFLGIEYDAAGRRAGITRASSRTTYGYDGASRLIAHGQRFAGGAGDVTASFGYNPASQITQRSRDNEGYAFPDYANVNRTYAVNGLNQYTSAGSTSFTYDANGNLTASGVNGYGYDAENRLVWASSGAVLAYDPLGRLWQTGGGNYGASQFLYDGDALVAEYDADTGAMRRRFMHGPSMDEPILWDEGASMTCASARFLHPDHQGSIVALADCYGNRTAVNSYDEYGIPGTANFTPSLRQRFQYTGQIWLPELGMYHYKARVYSPTLGRFLQTDPIGYDDQVNLYAYVANDPVNGRDPTGKECVNSNGMTHCVSAGRYDVTFKTPDGFKNTNPRAADYHQYYVPNVSSLNATQTREWVKNNPTPGNPSPATPQGTPNNATPSPLGAIISSPVMSYEAKNGVTGNNVVVNATLPGHPLGNGIVVRDVTANANGTSTIQNYGEGNGRLQAPGSPVAGAINNVWSTPSMAPPTPQTTPRYDLCMSHPGAC